MAVEGSPSRDRCAEWYQWRDGLPLDVAHYGPEVATENELRLLGDVAGKRILELGSGASPASIAFAKRGAIAIAVDPSPDLLAVARRRCEQQSVRVETRAGDLADLAFLRADSVDAVFSAWALAYVEDLTRLLRQVHRVLRVGGPFVFSVPHPAYDLIDDDADAPLVVRRSYFDRTSFAGNGDDGAHRRQHRTVAELVTALIRGSYRVDALLEPQPPPGGPHSALWREAFRYIPRTLILRARKEGH